jgi:hypothetical protein
MFAGLRDDLCRGRPRTVSFGAAVLTPEALPVRLSGHHWWREYVVYANGAVERSLFDGKHARRNGSGGAGHELGSSRRRRSTVDGAAGNPWSR